MLFAGLVLALDAFVPLQARADWTAAGAQFHCDADNGTFEILAYRTSSDGDSAIPPGFEVAADGFSDHRCALGKHGLLAQFEIIGPQARGECMGGGLARIQSLTVDDLELEEEPIDIDWICSDAPAVLRVKLKAVTNGIALTKCMAVDDTADGTRNDLPCQTTVIEIDAQVAALSKIDHDLADPATQAAQSATKIPADNDMAKVFAGQTDPSGAPICAHWQERSGWRPAPNQPWGRIGGEPQQRTPIQPVYPSLCTRKDDTACDPSGYLIAGDRVEIGFVCGAWTQVGYHPRLRSRPPATGWIETARIYGIQPLLTPEPPITYWVPPTEPVWKQPLLAAVLNDDSKAIEDLLRKGADPNLEARHATPLSIALGWSRVHAVELLLAAGAKLEPGISEGNRDGSTALMQVAARRSEKLWHTREPAQVENPVALAKLLLAHGAKIDATDRDGGTALFSAVQANNVDVAAFLLDAGANPNKTRGLGETGSDTAAVGTAYTPLMLAAYRYITLGDPSMTRLLLARGADPDFMAGKADYDSEDGGFAGETVLTYAADQGLMIVVKDLLEHGADPTRPRADGALPAQIGRDAGFPEIAELIESFRKSPAGSATEP
jgi:ankyrin repeat protein